MKIIDTKNLRAAELAAMDREVMTHSRLIHQNIIKFHKHFNENDKLVMVLEYAESGCLSDYLYNKKKLKEDEAFKIF